MTHRFVNLSVERKSKQSISLSTVSLSQLNQVLQGFIDLSKVLQGTEVDSWRLEEQHIYQPVTQSLSIHLYLLNLWVWPVATDALQLHWGSIHWAQCDRWYFIWGIQLYILLEWSLIQVLNNKSFKDFDNLKVTIKSQRALQWGKSKFNWAAIKASPRSILF